MGDTSFRRWRLGIRYGFITLLALVGALVAVRTFAVSVPIGQPAAVEAAAGGLATRYAITNNGASAMTARHHFASAGGASFDYADPNPIGPGASRAYDLATIDIVPWGFTGTVSVFADQPFTFADLPAATAAFDGSPRFGPKPLAVSFANQSTGSFSASSWDFGDGQASTLAEPTHVYSNTGVYTVTLTVSGAGGSDTLARQSFIQVTEPGTVDLVLVPVSATFGLSEVLAVQIEVRAGDQPIDGVEAHLDFDPTVLRVVNAAGQASATIEGIGPLDQVLLNAADNAAGRIDYAAGRLGGTPPTGTFAIATIRFQPITVTAATDLAFAFDLPNNRRTNVAYGGQTMLRQAAGGRFETVNETLIATVGLMGREVPSGEPWRVPLRVQLRRAGAAPVYSSTVSTDDVGRFALAGLSAGSYTVTVKGPHTLANVRSSIPVGRGTTAVDLCTLREGDASDDNRINVTDFSILAGTYARSSGQTGFDPRADFNDSHQVNILDFSLLAASYGRFGDQACP